MKTLTIICVMFLLGSPCTAQPMGGKNKTRMEPSFDVKEFNYRIVDKSSGSPSPGIRAYLTFPGIRFTMASAVSDSSGLLSFRVKAEPLDTQLILQTDFRLDSLYVFRKADPFIVHYRAQTVADSILDIIPLPYVDSAIKIPFYGEPDKRYLLDDYTRFPTMEEVIREYVKEVRIRNARKGFEFSVFNTPYLTYFEAGPLVLLDGLPVFDLDALMAIDPLQIRQLEIVARKFHAGSLVCNGILSFSTYNGLLGGYTLHPDAVVEDLPTQK